MSRMKKEEKEMKERSRGKQQHQTTLLENVGFLQGSLHDQYAPKKYRTLKEPAFLTVWSDAFIGPQVRVLLVKERAPQKPPGKTCHTL